VSMLTGIDYPERFPDDEAIVKKNEPFEDGRHKPVSVTTIFEIAKGEGLQTALIATDKRIKYVEKLKTLDVAQYLISDDEGLQFAIDLLSNKQGQPHLLFLHLIETDRAGHRYGWGNDKTGCPPSPQYLEALQNIDQRIGKLVKTLEQLNLWSQTLLIITSDHGGIDKGHGGGTTDELTIPWIVAGGLAQKRGQLQMERTIRVFDTAPTALAALDLPIPSGWDGKPIWEVLQGIVKPPFSTKAQRKGNLLDTETELMSYCCMD
ncbi:MAG: alkaline phosphatase family protein, partial [Thermoplasmatales archaeon]